MRRRNSGAWRFLAISVAGVLVVGCAPSLSTFQPAHVPPRGTVSASLGLEGSIPAGDITTLYDTGRDLAKRGQGGESIR